MADNLKKASNYCVICSNNSKKNPKVSFFRFPKDEKRCNEWKLKLHLPKLDSSTTEECYKKYRVCSAHFENCMFSSIQKNKLKRNAIPTKLIEAELDSISQPKASENIPESSDCDVSMTWEAFRISCDADEEDNIAVTSRTSDTERNVEDLPRSRISKELAVPANHLGEKLDENGVIDAPTAKKASEKNNQDKHTQPDLIENGDSVNEEGSENEEAANGTETLLDDDDCWSCLETSTLIATYGKHRNSFTRDGHELLAWDHISADLSLKNIHKTPESCEKKWKALFQIYLFNKRKPNRIHFEYQNEIDEIIGEEQVEAENRKRKRDCDCSERKMSEKNQRHRERMEMMKGKLDIEKQKLAAFQQYLAYLKSRGD